MKIKKLKKMAMSTIDPTRITNYKRTQEELEQFLIFCVCVAGKNAQRTAKAVDMFLDGNTGTPFERVRKMIKSDCLVYGLQRAGIGQYTRLSKCLNAMVNSVIDLKKVTIEELESIHGIGPKTSRFFILHSRKSQKVAVLDTHILKYLSKKGYKVPKATPSGRRYKEIEQIFLEIAKKLNTTPADLDLQIWKSGNKGEL